MMETASRERHAAILVCLVVFFALVGAWSWLDLICWELGHTTLYGLIFLRGVRVDDSLGMQHFSVVLITLAIFRGTLAIVAAWSIWKLKWWSRFLALIYFAYLFAEGAATLITSIIIIAHPGARAYLSICVGAAMSALMLSPVVKQMLPRNHAISIDQTTIGANS